VSGAPLRVEKALQLLPDLQVLAPLRSLVLSIARADVGMRWASSGPYLTVGKRGVDTAELRGRVPQLLQRVGEHVAFLYRTYADALDAQQSGDPGRAVEALLSAGEREESVRRWADAGAWYEAARPLAAALQSRRAETECLLRLGRLRVQLGDHSDAARHFQRSLALAEAEFDQSAAVEASRGLGDIALAQGEWAGANAWYQRALRLAEAASDARAIGQVQHQFGRLAHQRGDLTGAGEQLRAARERFEQLGEVTELAGVLNSQGLVDAALGRHGVALAAYREALAWAQRAPAAADLELSIRLNLVELALGTGRLLEAEEELRRAEESAVAHDLAGRLVRVYGLMGRLRGLHGDETGFVFFEQAVELCHMLGASPLDEAWVYHEYGLFRLRLGQGDEARAYLERAQELFGSLGKSLELERVRGDLERLTA